MTWTPSTVAYGIRHKRLFGFLGRAGDAIDAVLELQGSGAVPRKCFTRIGWPDAITARLSDDDDNFVLTFNVDGVILDVNFEEIEFTRTNARDMFIDIVSKALPVTNPGRAVDRIGIVETYNFPHSTPGSVATEVLTRLVGIGTATDFNIRVAFRRMGDQPEGEWRNTILQVGAGKKDERSESHDTLRVSIDHQHYFVPERVFSPRMVRDHYVAFLEEIEGLQQNQLSGLAASEVLSELRDG